MSFLAWVVPLKYRGIAQVPVPAHANEVGMWNEISAAINIPFLSEGRIRALHGMDRAEKNILSFNGYFQ